MIRGIRGLGFWSVGAAALVISASTASADTLQINFTTPYTSSVYPSEGGPNYMTATFEDVVGEIGAVRLTLSTAGLMAPSEFVSKWYFNLDPNLEAKNLRFTLDGVATTGPESAYKFVAGYDDLGLGGQAVGFDFGPTFSTSNKNDGTVRFDADETFVGILRTTEIGPGTPLRAASFNFLNPGGDFHFLGVAHVQGLANGQSTKLGGGGTFTPTNPGTAVPLPGPFAAGLILLCGFGMKRLRRPRASATL